MTIMEAPSPAHDDLPPAGSSATDQPSAPVTGAAATVPSRLETTFAGDPGPMTKPAVRDRPAATDGTADVVGPAAFGQEPQHAAHQALLERTQALKLIHSGQATTATVDTLCDTGARVNGRPVTEVHLLVERPGAEPYPVIRSAVAPDADIDLATAATASSGRPRRIPVLVDPGHPENVLLRWDLRPAS